MPDIVGVRLLVVDDSPEDRETYRRLLRTDSERRYEYVEAESGHEGLRAYREQQPDCVLLDYRLPDLDGLEFLVALGETEPPVIVLTGQGSEEVAVEAMKRGAQDYLPKDGITAPGLVRAIAYTVERVALRRAIERQQQDLVSTNLALTQQIAQRELAEERLQQMYQDLERLVAERTAELSRANNELVREMAERRRMEAERLELLVREREANRLKDQFLATMSHELRTPLNAVVTWTEVARLNQSNPELLQTAIDRIERNARLQVSLISDLLDVSRIVADKLAIDLKAIDPLDSVRAAVELVQSDISAKSIALETALQEWDEPLIADPMRLQQVVWNLLANAVKFTPEGGRIELRVLQTDARLELIVTDNGQGIEPAFLPHVFELFRQADGSASRLHGGLGIGLGVVGKIVALHGGTLEAHSKGRGRGSTFHVVLPRRPAVESAGT